MRVFAALLLALCLSVVSPSSSQAQCGDVNNNGGVDISDVITLLQYLVDTGPAPVDSTKADMDDRYGITISDLFMLLDVIFSGATPDCAIDNDYYYTCSTSDTVEVPFKYNIPVATTDVFLDVVATWHSGTRAYYIPIDPLAAGSNGAFAFSGVVAKSNEVQVFEAAPLIYVVGGYPTPVAPGTQVIVTLHYTRVTPGIFGRIVTEAKDRSPFLRLAIEKNDYNLHRPITIYKYPAGDLNCDTETDISDLTYFVDFLFLSGPPPCDPYDGP